LRPRHQAIKYTSSYHCLTHTWGLRLKKLLDPPSGAWPFDPRSGASPFRPTLGGFALSTHARGAWPFDPRSGASPFRPTLGGSALRRTLGGFPLSTRARGLPPFDPRSGAAPLRPTLRGPALQRTLGGSAHRPTRLIKIHKKHSEEFPKRHTYTIHKHGSVTWPGQCAAMP
jgi:hypothetical protein